MAGRYFQEIHNVKAHVISLYVVIGVMTLILAMVIYGWNNAPKDIRIHIPPDLTTGATFKVGEIHPSVVYVFSHYIFQQLNHWPDDGRSDYAKNIFKLRTFMTPRFQRQIQNDLQRRNSTGELSNRTRTIQQITGAGYTEERVETTAQNSWVVWLDFQVQETVNNVTVKDTFVRYALKVVRYDIDPTLNPWGLALDGFAEPTRRLSEQDIKSGL